MRPLNTVLRIKRTLDGAEIDKIISDVEAGKALATEQRRRAAWRKRELAASRFRAECDHCHGLDQIGCGNRQHQWPEGSPEVSGRMIANGPDV